MSRGYVDLHLHTTASDGVLRPSEIVRYAKAKRLQAIAITDHDTVEGCEEGLSEGERIGFEVIPGIEISAEHSPGSMHILGFFIDIHHPLRYPVDGATEANGPEDGPPCYFFNRFPSDRFHIEKIPIN